ncbi:MAG TPA: sigma-70 family RNA polymerase sigma factor [Pseudonocardiaceae bacterium]
MIEVDLQALRRGDESAYRAIVTGYHSTLLRLALIYSPNRATAEEAVQETWLAVLRGLDTYSGRASFRTWVCSILVNVARRRAAKEGRALPLSTFERDDAPAVSPDLFLESGEFTGHWKHMRDDWSRLPEDRMLSRELRDVVTAAIDELPPSQREVITLRDIEGWTTSEVSELLEIGDGHQRVLLHRARSRVRQALENYLATPVAAA